MSARKSLSVMEASLPHSVLRATYTLSLWHTFALGIFWRQLPFATNKRRCNYIDVLLAVPFHIEADLFVAVGNAGSEYCLFRSLTHHCWGRAANGDSYLRQQSTVTLLGWRVHNCTFDPLLNSLQCIIQYKQSPHLPP